MPLNINSGTQWVCGTWYATASFEKVKQITNQYQYLIEETPKNDTGDEDDRWKMIDDVGPGQAASVEAKLAIVFTDFFPLLSSAHFVRSEHQLELSP